MKKSDLFLLLLGFGFLMVVSEVLYTINHRPEFMEAVYVIMAKQAAVVGKTQLSFNFLKSAENLSLNTNARKYDLYKPDSNSNINLDSANNTFKTQYKEYMVTIPSPKWSGDKTNYIAKIFYNIGIIADKTGEIKTAEYFLRDAIYWNPFFSYYYIELANYYMVNGNTNQAKKVLDFCSNIDVTSAYCSEYLMDNFQKNYPNKVGFLKDKVEAFAQ